MTDSALSVGAGRSRGVADRAAVLRRGVRGRVLRGAAGALAFFAICQAFTMTRPVSEQYLPDATTTIGALADLLGDSAFWSRILETLSEWAAGMAISIAIAVPIGVVLGASDLLYRMFRGPLELLRPIPGIALLPLFILVFGQSFQATLWLVVYACVWPILLNTIYGVHDVAPTARDTARSFGLGRTEILLRVYIPSALPLALTGVRVAASIALIAAVAVELLIGTGAGIGAFINETVLSAQHMDVVYAATAATGLLGLMINALIHRAETLLCPWRQARGGEW
jgi:NitT/TauT family transport system permease protein